MITSAPINLKDIADVRWIKRSQRPSEFMLKLSKVRQRMADEALVNVAAKQHGNVVIQYATVIKRSEGKSVLFHTGCVVGSFRVEFGNVTGIVKEGDKDLT